MAIPKLDPTARKVLYLKVNERFIGAKERMARVEAAIKYNGYKSFNKFCLRNGMYPASVKKAMQSPRPSIISLYKLAVALGCSLAYLTEKDFTDE